MKAILLSAGRSFRMVPVADKNFLRFAGKALVVHQLEALKHAGISDVTIVAGKHNMARFKALSVSGVKLSFCEQKNLDDGMAGGVLAAGAKIKSGGALVVCSNDIVDVDVYRDVAKNGNGKMGFIVAQRVSDYFPGGYIKMHPGGNGAIQEIVEKPGKGKEPSDLVNLVVHYHPDIKALYQELKRANSSRDDRYERALSSLFKKIDYKVIPHKGFWQPIKYPWHMPSAARHFIEQQRSNGKAKLAKTAMISGHVVFGKGVRVMGNATIVGPAYIGDNTVIGNNVLVRDSHIGKNCVIGFGTEVARSYLGDDVWTHTNYIGDSVIGSDVSFGAGTVTGNLRLDESEIPVNVKNEKINTGLTKLGLITGDNIRVGVNTSFMPGVKLGSGSFVGAGIVVAEDIPEGNFVSGEWKLKIRKNKVKSLPMRNRD